MCILDVILIYAINNRNLNDEAEKSEWSKREVRPIEQVQQSKHPNYQRKLILPTLQNNCAPRELIPENIKLALKRLTLNDLKGYLSTSLKLAHDQFFNGQHGNENDAVRDIITIATFVNANPYISWDNNSVGIKRNILIRINLHMHMNICSFFSLE